MAETGKNAEKLCREALAAAEKAHAPYSNFHVGAALITTEGALHAGCNVENAAYPEGWCAETTAIAHMVMAGGGEIAEIAIAALEAERCAPCGGCRQRLAEFGAPGTKVHLCNREGVIETHRLEALIPQTFTLAGGI